MLQGESVVLAGELIPASECDYRSYVDLLLVCPDCKQPIFLVQGGSVREHVRNGKPIQGFIREAHFSHFEEKNRLFGCENRSDYSPIEIESRQTIARQQRLTVFVGHMYELLQNCPELLEIKDYPALIIAILADLTGEEKARFYYESFPAIFIQYLRRHQSHFIDKFAEDIIGKISKEAFLFLISEQGIIVTTTLFWIAAYQSCATNNLGEHFLKIIAANSLELEQYFLTIADRFCGFLKKTNWVAGLKETYRR